MDFFKDHYNPIDYDVSAFLIVLLESRFVFFDFQKYIDHYMIHLIWVKLYNFQFGEESGF